MRPIRFRPLVFPVVLAVLAAPLAAQEESASRAGEIHAARVTLQVLPAYGWSSNELQTLLQDPAALGSIDGLYVPAQTAASATDALPAGAVVIEARPCGPALLTLSARAGAEADAKRAVDRVVEHLVRLVAPEVEYARARLAQVEERFAAAEKNAHERRARLGALMDAHGAIPPSRRLDVMVKELEDAEQELRKWSAQQAELQARRDYLAAKLEGLPREAERPVRGGIDVAGLSAMADDLEADIARIRAGGAVADDHPQLAAARKKLELLRDTIDVESRATSAVDKRWQRTSDDLANADEELARATSRVAYLKDLVRRLDATSRELARLAADWRLLEHEVEVAAQELRNVRGELEAARNGRLGGDGMLRVVAGPEVARLPR